MVRRRALKRRPSVKARAKACPACEHPERRTIDNALRGGQAPRSVRRRYAGLNRKALTHHRDECLNPKGAA